MRLRTLTTGKDKCGDDVILKVTSKGIETSPMEGLYDDDLLAPKCRFARLLEATVD